jgi:hypothetical protein
MSTNNVEEFLTLLLNYFVETFSDLFYNGNLLDTRKKFVETSRDSKQLVFRHFMAELLAPQNDKTRYEFMLLLNFLDHYDALYHAKKDLSFIKNKPKLKKYILPMILYHNVTHIYINNSGHTKTFLENFISVYWEIFGSDIRSYYSTKEHAEDAKLILKFLKYPYGPPTSSSATTTSTPIVIPTATSSASISTTSTPVIPPTSSATISTTSIPVIPPTSSATISTTSTPIVIPPTSSATTTSTPVIPPTSSATISTTSTPIVIPPTSSATTTSTPVITLTPPRAAPSVSVSSASSVSSRGSHGSRGSRGSGVSKSSTSSGSTVLSVESVPSSLMNLLISNFQTPINTTIPDVFGRIINEHVENVLEASKKSNVGITPSTTSDTSTFPRSFFGQSNIFKPFGNGVNYNKIPSFTVLRADGLLTNDPLELQYLDIDNFIKNQQIEPNEWDTHIKMEYVSFLTADEIQGIQKIILRKMYDFLQELIPNTSFDFVNKILDDSYDEKGNLIRRGYKNLSSEEQKLPSNVITTVMKIYAIVFIQNSSVADNNTNQTIQYETITSSSEKNRFIKNVFLPFFTIQLRDEYIFEFLIPFLQSSCNPYCIFQNVGSDKITSDIDITILNTRGYILKLMAQKVTDVIFQPLFGLIDYDDTKSETFNYNKSLPGGESVSTEIKLSTNLSNLFDVNFYISGWYSFCFSDVSTYPYLTPIDQCYKIDEYFFDTLLPFFYSQINFACFRIFGLINTLGNEIGDFIKAGGSRLTSFYRTKFQVPLIESGNFNFAQSLYTKLTSMNSNDKFDYLQYIILLMEQCLRKYQIIMAKLTKKLIKMRDSKQSLNNQQVDDALIVRYQKIIEKRFMYEYLTLKSLEQCYEEEAYGSIGTYFHVVIQMQKQQFVDKFFSPFVYIMSFLDNIGMIVAHGTKKSDKYTKRIVDAAVRLCFSIDDMTCSQNGKCLETTTTNFGGKKTIESPSTSVAFDYRRQVADWMNSNENIRNAVDKLKVSLQCLVGEWDYKNNKQLEEFRKMGDEYNIRLENFTKKQQQTETAFGVVTRSQEKNTQEISGTQCKQNIVETMFEITNLMMNLLRSQQLNYSPYELDETVSSQNIQYHLPSTYSFFQNLSED